MRVLSTIIAIMDFSLFFNGEVLYYYVVEAKDGIIDSKFEIEGA